MSTFVERVLQIKGEHESRRILRLCCFAFLTAGAYVVCRSVADALFLANVGARHLPAMHVIATAFVVVLTVISLRWRNRPRGLLPTQLLLAMATLTVPLFDPEPSGTLAILVYGFLYILAQLHGTVGMIFLTILLQGQFHGDEPPRVFGIIGAGGTLAAIVFGVVVYWTVSSIEPVHLLYIVAALDVLAIVPVFSLSPEREEESDPIPDVGPPSSDAKKLPMSKLATAILMLVAIKVAALTFIEYQWKVSVADAKSGVEAAMAAYFGLYYTGMNIVTGVIQLLLAGRILRRFGALFALTLLPFSLLCGSILVLATSALHIRLWVSTLLKSTESLRRGINDPALQLLFKKVSRGQRELAVTKTHGIAKPLAELTAALGLQVIVLLITPAEISWLVLILIAVWFYLVARMYPILRSTFSASESAG